LPVASAATSDHMFAVLFGLEGLAESLAILVDVLRFGQKQMPVTACSSIGTRHGASPAAPIAAALWALMPEFALTVGADHYRKAPRHRRFIPRRSYSAHVDAGDCDPMRQSPNGKYGRRARSLMSPTDLVQDALRVSDDVKRRLPARISDLLEFAILHLGPQSRRRPDKTPPTALPTAHLTLGVRSGRPINI